MKVKTEELSNPALDWAVAKALGIQGWNPEADYKEWPAPMYSTDWAQGGPLIAREHTEFDFIEDEQTYRAYDGFTVGQGPTHLIAAMRCYVASKLGDEVDVPENLL